MAEKTKNKQTPIVGSIATQLKKTVTSSTSTQVATPEETAQRKSKLLGILDKSADVFLEALNNGTAEIKTSADFERIVKLTLLLSCEADSIQGKAPTIEEETQTNINSEISMSKVEEILDPTDPEVRAVFNKLYKGYNELNDKEGADK